MILVVLFFCRRARWVIGLRTQIAALLLLLFFRHTTLRAFAR